MNGLSVYFSLYAGRTLCSCKISLRFRFFYWWSFFTYVYLIKFYLLDGIYIRSAVRHIVFIILPNYCIISPNPSDPSDSRVHTRLWGWIIYMTEEEVASMLLFFFSNICQNRQFFPGSYEIVCDLFGYSKLVIVYFCKLLIFQIWTFRFDDEVLNLHLETSNHSIIVFKFTDYSSFQIVPIFITWIFYMYEFVWVICFFQLCFLAPLKFEYAIPKCITRIISVSAELLFWNVYFPNIFFSALKIPVSYQHNNTSTLSGPSDL